MDEELDQAVVYPNLDYVINWKGLTFEHIGLPLLFLAPLLYASLFFPYVKDIIPAWLVFAFGLALVTAIIVAQWRQPPEFIDFMWQKWTTADELSPFKEEPTEKELAVTNIDLWSDDDEGVTDGA